MTIPLLLFGLAALIGAVSVVAWVVGWCSKQLNIPLRRRKPMVIGFAKLAKTPAAAWRRRAGLVTGLAVATLGFTVACWLAALVVFPHNRPVLVVLGLVFVCCTVVAWHYCKTDGWSRTWAEANDLHRRKLEARAAVTSTHPEAVPGKVTVDGDRVSVAVQYVGDFNEQLVGQVLQAGHAELVPGGSMGVATVEVLPGPPPPPKTRWELMRDRGPLLLPPPDPRGTAPLRLGEDHHGNVHRLPPIVDPEWGAFVLVAGVTGAGKTVGVDAVLAQEAWRPHVAWVGLDPHRVELKPWAPRMSYVAKGIGACTVAASKLVEELDRRMKHLDDNDIAEWRIGPADDPNCDGPGLLWLVDEFAALPKSSWGDFARLCAEQRKAGMGCIIGTQRPEAKDVIPSIIRDNLRTRIAFATTSKDASKMILGEMPDGQVIDPTHVPVWLKGGYVIMLDRERIAGRAYLPSFGGTSKHDIADYVKWCAQATAHLRPALEMFPETVNA